MRRLLRLRTWVRLVAATVLALIALGWVLPDGAGYGYWHLGPKPTTLYMGPALAADGYEYWGTETWMSSDFCVYQTLTVDLFGQTPSPDPSGWSAVKEIPIPPWVIDVIQTGYSSVSRSELGWPLRFARAEFAYKPAVAEPVVDESAPFVSNGGWVLAKQTGVAWMGPVPIANHPLFPGFLLLVAAVYGLLLALEQALWIPARMRTRRRRKRGYCERCGYDLAGVTIGRCPECGTVARGGQTGLE